MRTRLAVPVALMAALLPIATGAAQTQAPQLTQIREANPPEQVRTFYLVNVPDRTDAEEIMSDVRNLLPRAHAYYVPSQGALSVRATAEEMALVEKLLSELDRKRKMYKVTYTISEIEGSRPIGTRHVEMLVPVGTRTNMKQGRRIPIVTASSAPESEKSSSQIQYIDVGLNIDADIEGTGEVFRLRTSVEESAVAEGKTTVVGQSPSIEQTRLEGSSILTQGRMTVLGTLDRPGVSGREEISVVAELVK
jgi:type II secretory pathway component GspD/PulD (secretin)